MQRTMLNSRRSKSHIIEFVSHHSNQVFRLLDELARLQRNAERREVREKAKGIVSGSTPATPGASTAGVLKGAGGTVRKCANCGEVGHIKTNKKWVKKRSSAQQHQYTI